MESASLTGAVVLGSTAGSATALSSSLGEGGSDSTAGAGSSGLEVLGELAGGTRGSSRRGLESQAAAVGKSSAGRSATGASAVTLHNGALGLVAEAAADLLSLGAVDVGGDLVADVGQSASNLGGVGLSIGDGTLGKDVERTTVAQVVGASDIEGDLNGLTSGNALEGILAETSGHGAEADTLKADTGLLGEVSIMSNRMV